MFGNQKDRHRLTRFVSGCERLPPLMHVQPLSTASPDSSLPHAATCFFALELPLYSSIDIMRDKLLYAIRHCADIDNDFAVNESDQRDDPLLVIEVDANSTAGGTGTGGGGGNVRPSGTFTSS